MTVLLRAVALLLISWSAMAQDASAYGEKPDQEQAQDLALGVLADLLKDPYSAQIEWAELVGTGRWEDSGPTCFGWVLFAKVNAKNSYGGYVGARDYRFFIRDGRVDCAVTSKRLTPRAQREVDVRVY